MIQKVSVGSPRTLLNAELANELIAALNSGTNVKVEPDSVGKLVQGDNGTIIDLAAAYDRLKEIEKRINNPSISVTCGVGNSVNVKITF